MSAVLLILQVVAFLLDLCCPLGVELHEEHAALGEREEGHAPRHTEDGPLAPLPHSSALIEARRLVEACGSGRHQSYREEELQTENTSGNRRQERHEDRGEEACKLHDRHMQQFACSREVGCKLKSLALCTNGHQLNDDCESLERFQPLFDHTFSEEPRVVLQLGGAFAFHKFDVIEKDCGVVRTW